MHPTVYDMPYLIQKSKVEKKRVADCRNVIEEMKSTLISKGYRLPKQMTSSKLTRLQMLQLVRDHLKALPDVTSPAPLSPSLKHSIAGILASRKSSTPPSFIDMPVYKPVETEELNNMKYKQYLQLFPTIFASLISRNQSFLVPDAPEGDEMIDIVG
ncbi:Protein CBG14033 [Caenorhabditis briggsae]|uniref:Protein CBG14033 n=1 Tax=Caenorhabditis briggsae TaxID=6238 RepID=A8XJ79_CAEBR|nr:Protein CBG14033 [Caenorhabditis briggsae]CAP32704.2 Protein CBG14033 [Caenorhabditis briggsae]